MLTQGQGAARLTFAGETNKSVAEGFVTIQTAGLRELADEYQRMAKDFGRIARLDLIAKKGAEIIEKSYVSRVADVTGNLRKSMGIKKKTYGESVGVAIVGPKMTGNQGADPEEGSGNHAFLVEFGTAKRHPGTQGRRTYINVHQLINGRMRRHSSANDSQFRNMSKGFYFLMGSKREPTRQARMGSGYPHDFGHTDGRMHPITLHPGEEYGAMPAQHPMERTITAEQQKVFSTLEAALKNSMDRLLK